MSLARKSAINTNIRYDYDVAEMLSKEELNYDKLAKVIAENSNKIEIDYDKLAKVIAENSSNIEINYDKLANSIVEASNKIESTENTTQKKEDDAKATFILLQMIAFYCSIAMFIVSLVFIIAIVNVLILQWTNSNIEEIFLLIILLILSVLITLLIGKSSIEIHKTNDKTLINTVFNALLAFAAVIIALIQLFQGGGCNCGK